MANDPRHLAALTAVRRLLGPLIPLLLEQGLGVGPFEEMIRSLYVEAACPLAQRSRRRVSSSRRDLSPTRGKPSIATVAMLTGLTRAVVAKLLNSGRERDHPNVIGHQRAERVLAGWQHDPHFRDDRTGAPALLPLRGSGRTFTSLVKRHSGDPRVRTLLTELLRVRAVRKHKDGHLELIRSTYASSQLDAQGIELIGELARDYIQTLVGNARHPGMPLYARRVINSRLNAREVGRLLRDIALQADATMESVDAAINDPSATLSARDPRPADRLGATFFVFHEAQSSGPELKGDGPHARARKRALGFSGRRRHK